MSNLNDRVEKIVKRAGLKGKNKYFLKALLHSGSSVKDALKKIESYTNINTGTGDDRHSTLSCPRCKNTMRVVSIYNGRKVKYCIYDRITLPLPV